ncbi:MAG: WD40/YVTN/BNR-like repeat-containing protein [Gammaproteobacteria bacterium]
MLIDVPLRHTFWATGFALCLAATAVAQADNHAGFGDELAAYSAPKVTESMLLDGARNAQRLIVVGEHGHIVLSDDDGASWAQAESPTRSALTGVTLIDGGIGFAVGHDAVILRTTDGGSAWERVHFDPDLQTPLLDVWFADAQRGFAVGAYGLFLETSDGGDTWARRPFFSEPLPLAEGEEPAEDGDTDDFDEDYVDPEYGEDFHLNHITAAADGTLYIAAEAGHYYRSDNAGATWYRLAPPYNGSFFGTLPLDGDSLLLFGMRGNLFLSDDKGLTYFAIETGVEALLTAGIRENDGRVVLVGLAGTVLESADGGRSFELHRQEDRRGNMMVLPGGGTGIVLIGESGVNRLTESAYRAGGKP